MTGVRFWGSGFFSHPCDPRNWRAALSLAPSDTTIDTNAQTHEIGRPVVEGHLRLHGRDAEKTLGGVPRSSVLRAGKRSSM
jgi:hypothetical protein